MKAITYREYGGPEVLQLEEGAKPAPKDDQVLVRVRAATLDPYDMHFLHGAPYFMRLSTGLRKAMFTGIGVDFSGVVESVGKNVTGFKTGDAVFGGHQGAFAEYIVISEQREPARTTIPSGHQDVSASEIRPERNAAASTLIPAVTLWHLLVFWRSPAR